MSKKRNVKQFNELVQNTFLHIQETKRLEIISAFDLTVCEEKLYKVGALLKNECSIDVLQKINNEMSAIFKTFGTNYLEDLISVCIGKTEFSDEKYDLLRKHFHPVSYKAIANKHGTDEVECAEIPPTEKSFHMKVHGLKLCINKGEKCLIIYGYVNNVNIDIINDSFINQRLQFIRQEKNDDFDNVAFERFIATLQLNDYLGWNQFNGKFAQYLHKFKTIQGKTSSQTMREFITYDNYTKRSMLIALLTVNTDQQLLAYLLFDIISNDNHGEEDSKDQIEILNSFPPCVKDYFNEAMKKTVQYTNKLNNFDINKVPLEQQICLMNTPDHVKEKAMVKLKEVKSKSEDSGSKSRQYLDGLLKLPFGVYKREPVLDIMDNMLKNYKLVNPSVKNPTLVEIARHLRQFDMDRFSELKRILLSKDKTTAIAYFNELTGLSIKAKTKKEFQHKLEEVFLTEDKFNGLFMEHDLTNLEMDTIRGQLDDMKNYTNSIKPTLDNYVHGHENAKKQIERIVGQWINGKPTGYCVGFEGNPGVGKTTLAKGLANCLKDENGEPRPFSIIAIGGDSNASTLVGHSFTYVGSIWGQIAQVLMDKKCMNPIILFDEVDKLSKTEHGKEITGILTHLLDPTQNDTFQDKYFSGIDLDLSKALFILSYNDPSAIDSILLDRVHRIKFESLTLDDKISVAKKHLLPEIYDKFNLENHICFKDETIQFIVENYTLEPGARKLKEKLYEIVGDYNLEILKNVHTSGTTTPYEITIDQIKTRYFKDKREVTPHKIHTESKVGLINALWANAMSQGGVLPLQVSWAPAGKFLELTLTGSLGNVMKESISVSLTNAWNLTSSKIQKELIKQYNNTKANEVYGLHIHCPDISTGKDGPSATTAFTVLLYSLFNNRKIKNDFGITGETNFGYDLTEIGGLQHKIIHSIPCGIKEFIFPVENKRDFEKIMEKYKDKEIVKGIKFHCIQTVAEVLELILE